jgi:hypothetical protein
MPWNANDMQHQFLRKHGEREGELSRLQKKVKTNRGYKHLLAETYGELLVYLLLSNTSAIADQASLLDKLKKMRSDGPIGASDAGDYDPAGVVRGWNSKLEQLIKTYSAG